MLDTLQFELVSPARILLSEAVGMAVVPGVEGHFGILPHHMPLLSSLRPGVVSIHLQLNSKASKKFFVDGGFAEVNSEGCILLVDEAIPIEDLTSDFIAQRQNAAQEQLESASSDEDKSAAEFSLAVAEAMARALAEDS